MASTGNMQPESGWIVHAGFNFLHPIQFHSSKEGLDSIAQSRPRSNLDSLIRFWPNASGPEASWCARIRGPGFWQNETIPLVSSLPVKGKKGWLTMDIMFLPHAGLVLGSLINTSEHKMAGRAVVSSKLSTNRMRNAVNLLFLSFFLFWIPCLQIGTLVFIHLFPFNS